MKNPFVFGKIVEKNNFCNRKSEILDLERNIRNGYSVWLFAPRRYGKSSLIKRVFENIDGEIKTIYFDFYNIQSVDDFCRKYLNILAKELFDWKDDIRKIGRQLGEYLKNLKPQINLDVYSNPSISLVNSKVEDQIDIEELLNLPEKISSHKKNKICIAFDEFQEISRINKFLLNWMRSSFQNHNNISYVFLGSKQSLMQNIFTEVNSPFYEFAVKMDIQSIKRDELFTFIKQKFVSQNLSICDKTIHDILDYSESHPHFTQYFASVVFDEIQSGRDENEDSFKLKWMNKIIDSQSVIFQNIYDQLNNNQRKILLAAANYEPELFSNSTRLKYNLPSSSTLSTNLSSLLSKDIIYKKNSVYKLSNPVFRQWILSLT